MQRAPVPSPVPKAEEPARPLYRFPDDTFTPEQVAGMDKVLDVDGEAFLRWLAGEGPDPCPESSG